MPRSRSMSMRSRYWARICRWSTTPVSWSIRSASVDLPWSMCAMMQKLRIRAGSVRLGSGTFVRGRGHAGSCRVLAVGSGGEGFGSFRRPHGPMRAGRRPDWEGPGPGGSRADCASRRPTGPGALSPLNTGRAAGHGDGTHLKYIPNRKGSFVANIKSQIKRIKTNEKARQRNKAVKSELKTAIRRPARPLPPVTPRRPPRRSGSPRRSSTRPSARVSAQEQRRQQEVGAGLAGRRPQGLNLTVSFGTAGRTRAGPLSSALA